MRKVSRKEKEELINKLRTLVAEAAPYSSAQPLTEIQLHNTGSLGSL